MYLCYREVIKIYEYMGTFNFRVEIENGDNQVRLKKENDRKKTAVGFWNSLDDIRGSISIDRVFTPNLREEARIEKIRLWKKAVICLWLGKGRGKMRALKDVEVDAPISIGDVLIKNVAGTEADIIATRDIRIIN